MNLKKASLLLTIICLTSSLFGANNYVSNNLYTYTHSGPGTKYKITGTVNAGEKIKVLTTNKTAGYTKIIDSKGRTVWIESRFISNEPGFKEQVEKLLISEEQAQTKLIDAEQSLSSNINQVAELQKVNLELSTELKKVQIINDSLSDRLDKEKNELLMQWFSYGGIVAGLGLLFGLILPSLIPSRKKKSSW